MSAPPTLSPGRDAPLLRAALADFDAAAERRRGEPAWLAERRRAALERLGATGFPTVRDEDWRFTNPAPIVRTAFRSAPRDGAADAVLDPAILEHPALTEALALVPAPAARLVFVDGRYEPALSNPARAGARFTAGPLALPQVPAALPATLFGADDLRPGAFADLNLAMFEDGAHVVFPRETSLGSPVLLVFAVTGRGGPVATHPRVAIVAEAGSRASVVEVHVSLAESLGSDAAGSAGDSAVAFANAVTEVACGADARIDHVRILRGTDRSIHVGAVRAIVGRDAAFGTLSLALGGRVGRVDVDVRLAGEGASCALDGLYVTRGREHVDHHTRIDHAVPRCTSREVYKGVLDGESTAVFAGRIEVREGAQKTDARQANHTLLLSERATIDTKPELEIFADDVKCAHGATVGQLDEDAVFYLRSRGVGRVAARAMLIHAFASEVLRRAAPAVEPERLEELLAGRLPAPDGEEAP